MWGNAIDDRRLDGKTRPRRSAGGVAVFVAGGVAVVLLPWVLILAVTLPPTYSADHWQLAWIGLDLAIAATAGLTAFLLHRRDPRAALAAVAAGTLLVADAWFDVTTAGPGLDHNLALAQALILEAPLAILAFVLASRTLAAIARSVPVQVPREAPSRPGRATDWPQHRSVSGRAA
ncbi:hypothetical protein [Streptomyces sp. SID13031]|uniref:hypothetical protein n=1 Tax=Streptomyces sp. SID13031 TaxID=2706046 RepID=UPI001944D6EE|nr:hypothetical protein [Streptomyces sp. SID13031]